MNTKSIWEFIKIGTALRYLQNSSPACPVHKESCIIENIDIFLAELKNLNLNVTRRASHHLVEMRKKLNEKPENSRLSYKESIELRNIITDIRKTLSAESRGIFVFKISDKRMDVDKLFNNVDKLFSPQVFSKCPEIARYDFQEAGKCIAFERPTAAAFHLMRGTEAVLREYYKKFIHPQKNNLWKNIISDLRSKKRGKLPDSTLLNNLDNIRYSFRNPTQHPEKIYDIEEAQDLFGICIDVVNRMCK